MARRAFGWTIVGALLLTGCGSSQTSPTPAVVVLLANSEFSSFTAETTLTVTDNTTWQNRWLQVVGSSGPARPNVDFPYEFVVIASMGPKPSTGHAVSFTSASETNDVISVGVQFKSPGSGCAGLTVVTFPVAAARIVRLARPPELVQHRLRGRYPTVEFAVTRTTGC